MLGVILDALFGGGRNALVETLRALRAGEREEGRARAAALAQMAAEFGASRGPFDRLMDGVNRLPRPMLALGVIGLFGSAMADPDWFADRMAGVALVPGPMWWLLGVIVSFYFGARHQAKGQAWGLTLAELLARTDARRAGGPGNAALEEWRRG